MVCSPRSSSSSVMRIVSFSFPRALSPSSCRAFFSGGPSGETGVTLELPMPVVPVTVPAPRPLGLWRLRFDQHFPRSRTSHLTTEPSPFKSFSVDFLSYGTPRSEVAVLCFRSTVSSTSFSSSSASSSSLSSAHLRNPLLPRLLLQITCVGGDVIKQIRGVSAREWDSIGNGNSSSDCSLPKLLNVPVSSKEPPKKEEKSVYTKHGKICEMYTKEKLNQNNPI